MALSPNNKCRVFLIPYMARGHIIPMTDFAGLLAAAHPDVEPTIVVSLGNAALIEASLEQSRSSGQVQIVTYPFLSDQGSKTSVETMGVGSKEETIVVQKSSSLIRVALSELLREYKPDAVVTDMLFHWAPGTAAEFGIPCIVFLSSGIFSLIVYRHIYNEMQPSMGVDDCVTVSDIPGPEIVMPVCEAANYPVGQDEVTSKILDSLFGSWPEVSGIAVNTFRALESDYCQEYERVQTKKAYFIGPVNYCNASSGDGAIYRGGNGDAACLKWLDGKENGSVVFVSFGSECYFKPEQLRKLAKGLEESGRNFLWVVRGDSTKEWMPDEWEETIAGRGFVVKGWAPQIAILSHPATGVFMTHCGWNSVLESLSAGVPMLTWPIACEQFINERFLVEVVGCAAKVWDDGRRSTKEDEHELVPGSAIASAVSRFMEPGGAYVTMRARAQTAAELALAAVQEDGSSRTDVRNLVNDLIRLKELKGCNADQ